MAPVSSDSSAAISLLDMHTLLIHPPSSCTASMRSLVQRSGRKSSVGVSLASSSPKRVKSAAAYGFDSCQWRETSHPHREPPTAGSVQPTSRHCRVVSQRRPRLHQVTFPTTPSEPCVHLSMHTALQGCGLTSQGFLHHPVHHWYILSAFPCTPFPVYQALPRSFEYYEYSLAMRFSSFRRSRRFT